jgi:AcrR family transcriptional regulator
MDIRWKLLDAAARVYAETGYRGATTRRIAQLAGVNEVTLFRHFGSKDALIREALTHAEPGVDGAQLPDEPIDPQRELSEWALVQFNLIHAARSIIRKSISELEEHPDISGVGMNCPRHGAEDLLAYLTRLRQRGIARRDAEPRAAARMLMGAIFSEALTRDIAPERFPHSPEQAMRTYVALLLRAIGVEPKRRRARSPHRNARH